MPTLDNRIVKRYNKVSEQNLNERCLYEKLTTSELVKSLAIPMITFGIGAVAQLGHIMNDSDFNGIDDTFIFALVNMVLGGILPILMTLFGHIHTERYFLKRIIAIVACVVLSNFVQGLFQRNVVINTLSGDGTLLQFTVEFVFCAGELLFNILKVQDENTTDSERSVMLLSDSIFWLLLANIYHWAFVVWFKTA